MLNLIQVLIVFLITFSFNCVSFNKDIDFGYEPKVIDSLISHSELYVQVTGFQNLDGNIAIAIYNSSDTFKSKKIYYRDTIISINSNVMNIHFDSMDPGVYAISVLHDADQSGDMEMGGVFSLIPKEGFGYSNNPKIIFSEPTFRICEFEIKEGLIVSVPISLTYM